LFRSLLDRKADHVANDLLDRIVRGELEVGSLLPKEAELATRYEVNRSVVREAVKLLEVHRLLRPKRRVGTEVLDPLASMSPEVLRAMLVSKRGAIDPEVLSSFLEIRAVLDEQMTVLAADRRTRADITALRAAVRELRGRVDEPDVYAARAATMGLTLARATKNPIFTMLAHWNRAVVEQLEHVFAAVRPPPGAHVEGLDQLVRFIEARDGESARALVRTFHEWAIPRLLATAALSSGASLSDVKKVLR
jgi:GntR family transcriptional repressor for pyruvate dehydrogenase complex